MNKRKINILVVYTDTIGGVGFYRSTQPHNYILNHYGDEFNVKFETNPNFSNLDEFSMYDLIHFHKGVYPNQEGFYKLLEYCKNNKIVTVIDIDDYWTLGTHHPQYRLATKFNIGETIRKSLQLCDYVTTTTDLFAKKIKLLNKNVKILPNAIDPTDDSFKINKQPCEKIRIGMVMGSTHLYDVYTMDDFVKKLPKDVLDKVCFVLCGFDTRGEFKSVQPDGSISRRPIRPDETVWYKYEQIITDNYKNVSATYKDFLLKFMPNTEYPNAVNEGYVRKWTKPMNEYYKHYEYIDVLLAPIEENDFNLCKSQLKAIECAFSNTAFIGSNFGPYTIDLKSLFEKGGKINEDGNAILIDKNKAHKDWAKSIEKLVKNPDLIKKLQNNLHNTYKDKYSLENVTRDRVEFYKQIIGDKKIN
jgi:glycosyltransferase involved in cell wall biosynthesis